MKPFFKFAGCLQVGVFVLAASTLALSQAATLWTGPNTNWTKSVSTPSDTILAGKVVLTRGSRDVMYNTAAGESSPGPSSPADTLWGFGDITNYLTLTYQSLESMRNGNTAGVLLNQPMVMHIVNEDIYLSIKFTTWGQFGAGTVAYTRSTPPPPAPPTVSITSPLPGAAFGAPASVSLTANATVNVGTVTNVAYFAGATSLGHATVAPFSVTGSIPAVGAYALTAVATAGGLSATSAVVNITVSSRPTATLTAPSGGVILAAPSNLSLARNASVSGGTVTNVSFFNSTTLLGSDPSSPFSITASNLTAGAYALTAVATAAGVSGTSAVVNITVVSPVAVSLTVPSISAGSGGSLIWTGPNTNWTKSVSTPSDTILPGAVVLTRGGNNVLYNTAAGEAFPGGASPADTEWAFGDITNRATLSYQSLASMRNGDLASLILNQPMVVHLLNENIYLSLKFTDWGQFGAGTVAYTRSTPLPSSPPTVSFSYTANPGLSYVVQSSSNLVNWVSVVTNVAASNSVAYSEVFSRTNPPHFFRVGRLPNP